MTDAVRTSPAPDPAVPSVARRYDYMLGGKENYASDRAAVARLAEQAPAVPKFARQNREFRNRAGLPTQESAPEVARAINPSARIVYVDNDPVVLAHSRALLSDAPDVAFVAGGVRDPAGLLRDPDESSPLLAGFSLVEPGLVPISQWQPPVPGPEEFDGFVAAVGRKD